MRRFITYGLLLTFVFSFGMVASAQDAVADCPTDNFLDVQLAPENSAYPAPELSVACTDELVVITSNAIPNFEFLRTTPGDLTAQDFVWEIPRNPVIADESTEIPIVGTVAIAVNGIPIFGPNEAPQDDYGDPILDELLDYCMGHVGGGTYHFHASPTCLFEEYDGNIGLVVGYALDGFPILAPFVCSDESCEDSVELTSSWQRTSDVRNAWEANEYIDGSGDLDECNGMLMDDGSYAYFATQTFPYFLACYTGEVDAATLLPTGGMGAPDGQQGGQQGQGQPPQNGEGQGERPPRDGQQGGDGAPPPPPGGGRGQGNG